MRYYLDREKYGVFSNEEVELLCKVLDAAWSVLLTDPCREDVNRRDELAHLIVTSAMGGERDPDRLKAAALRRLAEIR